MSFESSVSGVLVNPGKSNKLSPDLIRFWAVLLKNLSDLKYISVNLIDKGESKKTGIAGTILFSTKEFIS